MLGTPKVLILADFPDLITVYSRNVLKIVLK